MPSRPTPPREGPLRPTPFEPDLLAQGAYYAATGAWPLLHMASFEAVTGPKREHWLVHTVGALALGVGTGLASAALQRRGTREVRRIAALTALAFVAVEVPTVLRGRISPVYLLDAVVELRFLARVLPRRR